MKKILGLQLAGITILFFFLSNQNMVFAQHSLEFTHNATEASTDRFYFSTPTALTGNYTLEFWLKYVPTPGANLNLALFSPWTVNDDRPIIFINEATKGINVYHAGPNTSTWTGLTLTENVWQHVVITYSGSEMKGYLNGELQGTGTHPNYGCTVSDFYLGYSPGNQGYNGSMDEVMLWNYARSLEEIKSDMRGFVAGTETGLMAYFEMDEGSGQVLVNKKSGGENGTLGEDATAAINDPAWSSDYPQKDLGIFPIMPSLWYRADRAKIIGSDLYWFNEGTIPNANAHAPSNGSTTPQLVTSGTSTINYNPVLSFDGFDDFLRVNTLSADPFLTDASGYQSVVAFVVYRKKSNPAAKDPVFLLGSQESPENWKIGAYVDTRARVQGFTTNVFSGTPAFDVGSHAVLYFNAKVKSGEPIQGFLEYDYDNKSRTQFSNGSFADNSFAQYLDFGAFEGNYADIDIAELIVFPAPISFLDTFLQEVNTYLYTKYGFSIGNNQPDGDYKFSNSDGDRIFEANTISGSFHDLTVIGRDDVFGLNQTRSSSKYTGNNDVAIPGNLHVEMSNPSDMDDKDFLFLFSHYSRLLGDNPNVEITNGFNKRIKQHWAVEKPENHWDNPSKSIGLIDLSIDLTGVTVTGTTVKDFALIINRLLPNFPNFGGENSKIIPATRLEGNKVIFEQVDLFSGVSQSTVVFALLTDANQPSVWYEANTGVTTGATFTWANQGTTASANLVQATADNQPVYNTGSSNNTINFQNTISFDGNNDFLRTASNIANVTGDQSGTAIGSQFVVYKRGSSGADGGYLYDYRVNGSNDKLAAKVEGTLSQDGLTKSTGTSFVPGELGLISMTASTSSSSSALSYYKNGLAGTTAGGSYATATTPGQFSVGAGVGGGTNSQSDIAEIIVFPKVLSESARKGVESALALKYGISLGENTTAVSYTDAVGNEIWPADATYKYDIFGLGKQTEMKLNVVESNSMNTGSGNGTGQIGKGNLVLNDRIAFSENQYLIIGHDNGILEEQALELPGVLPTSKRLTRTWKVKNINGVPKFDLKFNRTGLNVTGTALADFKLLIDTDGDGNFSTGTVTVIDPAITQYDIHLLFQEIDIPDNAVFSIATNYKLPVIPGGNEGGTFWLKGNEGTTSSGTTLTGWTDQFGATISVSGNPQTGVSKINFYNVVDFDGNGDYLTSNSPVTFRKVLAVIKRNEPNDEGTILSSSDESTDIKYLGKGDNLKTHDGNYSWSSLEAAGTSAPRIVYWHFQDGIPVSAAIGPRVDGKIADTDPLFDASNYSMFSGIPYVGRAPDDVFPSFFNGQVAEVIISNESRENATYFDYTYLAVKYGITLAIELQGRVNYKLRDYNQDLYGGPEAETHWHDVFGIGRDDLSGLNQLQSNSANTGIGDGTGQSGKGNVVISNPGSLDNGDFLMTGHDNGSLAEQDTELPAGISGGKRIGREWYVQLVGNPGTVDLSFDITGLQVSGSSQVNFKLLIDADGDFSSGANIVDASSFSGNKIVFTGVTLPDEYHFTFVTFSNPPPPPPLPDPVLWLKADVGVSTNASVVTAWTDQANTNTFTINGNPELRVSDINFNNSVQFLGNVDWLAGDTEIQFQTLYAVIQRNSTSNLDVLIGTTTNEGSMLAGELMLSGVSTDRFRSTGTLVQDQFQLAEVEILPNTPLDGHKTYIDGEFFPTQALSGTGPLNPFTGIPDIAKLDGTSSPLFNGQIAELIMYGASHSDADRNKIQSYIAIKYGITLNPSVTNYLASDGSVIWNNTTYWNDVFGIGKDAGFGLDQPQSNSVNTGSGNGTGQSGKGNIVLSNPTSLDDGEFLIIGHDNGAFDRQITGLPLGLPAGFARLERKWLADMTGDSGDVDIKFDVSGLSGFGSTATNDFRLLIDRDGDGDFTTGTVAQIEPNNINGTVLTFEQVNFSNADGKDVFTFATRQAPTTGPGVTGVNFWLKANAGITGVSGVSSWADQSNNGWNPTQSDISKQPTIQTTGDDMINFNPTVLFSDGQLLSTQNVPDLLGIDGDKENISQFVVYKPFSLQGKLYLHGETNTSNPRMDVTTRGVFNHQGNVMEPNSLASVGTPILFDMIGTSSSITANQSFSLKRNGLEGYVKKGAYRNGPTDKPLLFGHIPIAGKKFALAEIINYPKILTAEERIKIESYLAIKYGISLDPSVTNYVNSAGTAVWNTTTYWHDVFGIGKDDASGLNQTSSNSINTGSGDGTGQTGEGNIVLSIPSSLDDGDFLMLGHDNAALSEQTTDLPAGLAGFKRLEREWWVQKTGDPGAVTLAFDLNGITVTGASADQFRLLIDGDSDGDFTTGQPILVVADSFTGNIATFSGVNLPNNRAIALITEAPTPGGVGNESLWLEANSGITLSGNNVTGWADQTALNFFTVTGTPTYNTNAINFNPSVGFNNTGDGSALPVNRLDGNNEIAAVSTFAVMRSNTNTSSLLGSTNKGLDYGPVIYGYNGDENLSATNGITGRFKYFDNTAERSNYAIINLDISNANSYSLNGSTNGLLEQGTGTFNTLALTPMIGGTNNNGNAAGLSPFDGEVAEIIVYPAGITAADKLEINSYLAIKYGITLDPAVVNYVDSQGTPVWNDTSHWQDVFGIARDDDSGLLQETSNSINTGSGDGTGQSGKGNIVLSNPTGLGNLSYVMVGHDSGVLSETNIVPSAYNCYRRLVRQWKMQVTGSVSTVDLSFDIDGLAVTGTEFVDFKILIDTDGDGNFNTGTLQTVDATALNGNRVEFNGIIPVNGIVFTFLTGPETEAPVIILNGNASITIEACTETYTEQGANATDNCSVGAVTVGGDVVDENTPGVYTVTYNVTDDNGIPTAQVNRIVTVQDTTAPVIILTGANPQVLEACSVYVELGATVSDCENGLSVSIDTSAVDMSTPGNYTVTYNVTDSSSNAATQVNRTVTVQDTTAPVISLNGPATLTLEACTDTYTELGASVADCETGLSVTIGGDTVDANIPGIYTITYNVTDTAGNPATQVIRTVTVEDSVLPSITCATDDSRGTNLLCNYRVQGTEFDATFTDNCAGGSITNDYNGSATLANATFTIGDHIITWTATDGAGNTATCTTTITVVDDVDPTIDCVADATRNTDSGVCTYTVQGIEFDSNAGDNCGSGNVTTTNNYTNTGTLSGSVLPLGDTVVTWTSTDAAGNTASCSVTITVVDNQGPTVTCAANGSRDTDSGACTYTVQGTEFDPAVSDCSTTTITNTFNGASTLAGAILPIGTTTVNWLVVDAAGNLANCSVDITVVDNEDPVLTCPTDATVTVNQGDTYTLPDYVLDGNVTVTDNCTTGSITQIPAPGTSLSEATHTISFLVSDGSGNTANCSFELTVSSTLSVDDSQLSLNSISIYPNPAKNQVVIMNKSQLALKKAIIYDLRGRQVKSVDLIGNNNPNINLDVTNLESASYFLLIQGEQGLKTFKLIVNK